MSNLLSFFMSLGPIISLIGTYLLILSYSKAHEIEHTISKGKLAEGTVIELREDPDHIDTSTKYRRKAPTVDFHTINGWHRHHSTTYRYPCPYEVGQKVKIYHYLYRSRHEMALEDDEPGTLPQKLLTWGLFVCAIGYPILLSRLHGLF